LAAVLMWVQMLMWVLVQVPMRVPMLVLEWV